MKKIKFEQIHFQRNGGEVDWIILQYYNPWGFGLIVFFSELQYVDMTTKKKAKMLKGNQIGTKFSK